MIFRQVAWIQAAAGLYPHPWNQVKPFHEQGWGGYRDASFPEDQVRGILKAFISCDPALSVYYQSHHRTTYRIELNMKRNVTVFLKHYRFHELSLFNPRSYLRFGHPQKSFRLFYLLEKMGIPTAKALFYLKENGKWLRSDGLLGTQEVACTMELEDWIKRRFPMLAPRERETFLTDLASFVAMLHKKGFCHGALASSTRISHESYQFYVMDLDSIRTIGSMLARDRRKDLANIEQCLMRSGCTDQTMDLFRKAYRKQLGH